MVAQKPFYSSSTCLSTATVDLLATCRRYGYSTTISHAANSMARAAVGRRAAARLIYTRSWPPATLNARARSILSTVSVAQITSNDLLVVLLRLPPFFTRRRRQLLFCDCQRTLIFAPQFLMRQFKTG